MVQHFYKQLQTGYIKWIDKKKKKRFSIKLIFTGSYVPYFITFILVNWVLWVQIVLWIVVLLVTTKFLSADICS